MLLLGFLCKFGILGGVTLVFTAEPPPLSSFTQLGLEANAGEGLGKAGLDSDRVEVREGLLRGGFGPRPLVSERGGFKGVCCL